MSRYQKILFCLMSLVGLLFGMKGFAERHEGRDPIAEFAGRFKQQLVAIPAGSFSMGDYDGEFNGSLWHKHGRNVNLPVHKVALDGFWMSPHKVTMAEFDFFLSNRESSESEGLPANQGRLAQMPAYLDWYQAHDFCAWLANVSGQPYGLPTEAQWEYAARNLGGPVPVATDNGSWRFENGGDLHDDVIGLNVAFYRNRLEFTREAGIPNAEAGMPVASFPPNPLGLYDMTDGGTEWVNDWYDPDYYRVLPGGQPHRAGRPCLQKPRHQ
ncbi:formylglycine-generating enzyme family protein [Pseudomonas sp. KNUC1026]|uniref:formylglycine-generating enzyme family protein n=1 Tax=Pseudomonas sp. KNUC1026 TaxID=2893890 RepID=UPI001F223D2D|nr:formylglycine-generating enzyme family protein [Pseudomonas sp. KNUC1026]UFH51522.1 formylglycine-generating enzyme family protein [Pseudomonas sp. KNUC1026]